MQMVIEFVTWNLFLLGIISFVLMFVRLWVNARLATRARKNYEKLIDDIEFVTRDFHRILEGKRPREIDHFLFTEIRRRNKLAHKHSRFSHDAARKLFKLYMEAKQVGRENDAEVYVKEKFEHQKSRMINQKVYYDHVVNAQSPAFFGLSYGLIFSLAITIISYRYGVILGPLRFALSGLGIILIVLEMILGRKREKKAKKIKIQKKKK